MKTLIEIREKYLLESFGNNKKLENSEMENSEHFILRSKEQQAIKKQNPTKFQE